MKNKDNKDNFEPLFEIIEQIESKQVPLGEQVKPESEPIIDDEPIVAEENQDVIILDEDDNTDEKNIQDNVILEDDSDGETAVNEADSDETAEDSEETAAIEEENVSLDDYALEEFSEDEVAEEEQKRNGFAGWWNRRKTWQKALMVSCISFVLVFSILFGIFMVVFDYNYNEITSDPVELGFEEVIEENIVNVALFGIDTRSITSFEGNSDSIMILSLNTKTKKVKIISVMRDTLVPITQDGKTTYSKINSAYAKGGPELAVKTLNTVFGLDISEYATVNFFGMVDIIDAVGGIEAELTNGEVTRNTNIKAINFCINELCKKLKLNAADYRIYTPGVQKLNGVQAVAYSRIRYVQNIWGTNNDYGRTDRQRYVMEQLFNKAITLDKSKYISLAKSLIPCSQTSLSYTEIIDLAFGILLESPTFEQTRMPQEEFLMPSPQGRFGSVVYYDLDFAKNLIHQFIYNEITPESYVQTNGIRKYDWYANRYSSNGSLAPNSNEGNTYYPAPETNNGYVQPDYNTGNTTPNYNYNQNSYVSTPDTTVPTISDGTTTTPDLETPSDVVDSTTSDTSSEISGTDGENTSSENQSGDSSNTSSNVSSVPDTSSESSGSDVTSSDNSSSDSGSEPDTDSSTPDSTPSDGSPSGDSNIPAE